MNFPENMDIKITVDEHKMKTLEMATTSGGRVVILDFTKMGINDPNFTDIGSITVTSPNGIGINDWIRDDQKSLNRQIEHIRGNRWLDSKERNILVKFLHGMRAVTTK